ELPERETVPEKGAVEAVGIALLMILTSPPIAVGPKRMLAGPLMTSIWEMPASSIGTACAGSNVEISPVRRPFSRTRTLLSESPRRTGREGADPIERTATPGRSEIFSAKLEPGLWCNSTIDFDSADWYWSSAGRAYGDAETTISSTSIADSRSSNESSAVLSFTRTDSVAGA